MPTLYYGDPASFKAYNKSVKSVQNLVGDEFDAYVLLLDGVVRPVLEGELFQVFESVPEPDSTMLNAVSVLWLFAMTEECQETKAAVQRAPEGGYPAAVKTKYELLMERVKSGAIYVPGAVRRTGGAPSARACTPDRAQIHPRDEPMDATEAFQKGLRS